MSKYLPFIKATIKVLEDNNFLNSIDRVNAFYDEPQIFSYSTSLSYAFHTKYSDGRTYEIIGGGHSFFSKEEALSKCLGELLERACLYSYPKERIHYFKNYKAVKPSTLNLKRYKRYNTNTHQIKGWVKGSNLLTHTETYLPAQQVFIPYTRENDEEILIEPNSTGTAGGFTHEEALSRSIYEIIERDAFMTTYLGMLPAQKIDLSALNNKELDEILSLCQKYYLRLEVIDITSDLGVPTYLSLLLDKTNLGPAVSVGISSNLNQLHALLSSIVESFVARQWIRHQMILRSLKNETVTINTQYIATVADRAFLWSQPTMLEKLDFLLYQPSKKIKLNNQKIDSPTALKQLTNILKSKNIEIYYTDISLNFFSNLNYRVYRTLIPQLQPFYLNEYNKQIDSERINEVASIYNFKPNRINEVPHPML